MIDFRRLRFQVAGLPTRTVAARGIDEQGPSGRWKCWTGWTCRTHWTCQTVLTAVVVGWGLAGCGASPDEAADGGVDREPAPAAVAVDIDVEDTAQPRGLLLNTPDARPGYVYFAPLLSDTTYLIETVSGAVVRTWESELVPSAFVYLLDNGHLLRGGRDLDAPVFSGGGQGGRIQEFSWEGDLVWDYRFASEEHLLHHDVAVMPNGNILAIAWEAKSRDETRQQGPPTRDDPGRRGVAGHDPRVRAPAARRRPRGLGVACVGPHGPEPRCEPGRPRRPVSPSRADRHQRGTPTAGGHRGGRAGSLSGGRLRPGRQRARPVVGAAAHERDRLQRGPRSDRDEHPRVQRDLDHRPQHDDRGGGGTHRWALGARRGPAVSLGESAGLRPRRGGGATHVRPA